MFICVYIGQISSKTWDIAQNISNLDIHSRTVGKKKYLIGLNRQGICRKMTYNTTGHSYKSPLLSNGFESPVSSRDCD